MQQISWAPTLSHELRIQGWIRQNICLLRVYARESRQIVPNVVGVLGTQRIGAPCPPMGIGIWRTARNSLVQLRRGRGLQAHQKVWDIWNSVQVGLRLPETNGQEVSRKKTLRSRQRLRTVVLEGELERGRMGFWLQGDPMGWSRWEWDLKQGHDFCDCCNAQESHDWGLTQSPEVIQKVGHTRFGSQEHMGEEVKKGRSGMTTWFLWVDRDTIHWMAMGC